MRYGSARYSSRVFIILLLAFYDFFHHQNIDFLDWLMLRDGDRCTPIFAECVMAASASWCAHGIPQTFKHSAQFIKSQIVGKA